MEAKARQLLTSLSPLSALDHHHQSMEAKAKLCKTGTSETGQEIKLHEEEPQLDPASFARSYQLEALEMAIEQNTIAFLETGSGKTLIAVMLLRAYAHAIRKPSDSIAVFLVPTVVLVTQQASVLEMHTDLKVGQFYGEMGVDFWSAETWKKQLEQYEVFGFCWWRNTQEWGVWRQNPRRERWR